MDKFKMVPVEPTDAMLAEIHLVEAFTNAALRARYRAMLAAAPAPAFDEAAERADFCKILIKEGYHPAQLAKMPGDGDYIVAHVQQQWSGYLACARLKAGLTGHE